MKPSIFRIVLLAGFLTLAAGFAMAGDKDAKQPAQPSGQRPIIYVMPNAFATPGSSENSQVLVDSAHNGKEPQVAKIYQELQHRKECQQFSENIDNKKADYFLLLQHGGGLGNRWALSGRDGAIIASGQSITLGMSVKDACVAITKDWATRASASR